MKIAVVGMGYVGLPLAIELSKHFPVVGLDKNTAKIDELKENNDSTGEVSEEELSKANIEFTSDPSKIAEANFIIVCVPTPVNEKNEPDLTYLESASETIGENISEGSIIVFESTVYPGVTEEVCGHIIEKKSGMILGKDFKLGYSPERINPGDKEHVIDKVVKIVSGSDKDSLEKIDSVYGKITKTHKASSIRVAESAKVIENIQRDLNIALMNELQIVFDKLNINFKDVLEAAGTKWNFHKYHPGLVGGHCIPVDPYYLTYKAQQVGYNPKVILAGRETNDDMYKFYSEKIVEKLNKKGKTISGSRILVLGLTFKPNVKDYRNSKAKHLIRDLKSRGINVMGCDPLLSDEIVEKNFDVKNYRLEEAKDKADLIVVAVEHDEFKNIGSENVYRLWE